jgi:hypothetical protein
MYRNCPQPVTPYQVGVVLDPDERPLIEIPARLINEPPPLNWGRKGWCSPMRPWLITDSRIVGRLGDDRVYGWRWQHLTGIRVNLCIRHEVVSLDTWDGLPLTWAGPAVAPLAVAAIYKLYGPAALLDHPGLAVLRAEPQFN